MNRFSVPISFRSTGSVAESAFYLVLHDFVALFGSLLAGFIGVVALAPSQYLLNHPVLDRLLSSQFNPGFWVPSIVIGFVAYFYTRHPATYWVGSLNLVLLLIMALCVAAHRQTNVSLSRSLFCELLATDTQCGVNASFARLIFVGPILGSLAYSIGAGIALTGKKVTEILNDV